MIQFYFPDLRRRLQKLEQRQAAKQLPDAYLCWANDDGQICMIAGPKLNWHRAEGDNGPAPPIPLPGPNQPPPILVFS